MEQGLEISFHGIRSVLQVWFEEGRKTLIIMGKNIITKNMKGLLQKHNITLYSIENEEKSITCEP